jgi:toxin CcdB
VRQFDVIQNPSPRSREMAPLVVVLQSHLLDAMPTVVIAPMLAADEFTAYSRTTAKVEFGDLRYVVSIAELAAADVRHLANSQGNLLAFEDELRRALNVVFTGF